MTRLFRSIATVLATLLLSGALHAAPPQPPGPPPPSDGVSKRPIRVKPPAEVPTFTLVPGCQAPAPQVQVKVQNVYVQLTWSPMAGATTYWVGRSVPSRSGSGTKLTPGPFLATEFWDAVPDIRDAYQYTVTAVDANGCTGATSVAVPGPFPTPNPQFAGAGHPDPTRAVLMWTEQFGAISYRIDGAGIPITGRYISGTTFELGKKPAYIGTLRQVGSSTRYELMADVPGAGIAPSEYRITAQYPGASDYANPGKIWVPRVTPIITSISPDKGTLGETLVKITGKYLSDSSDPERPEVRFGVPRDGAMESTPGKVMPAKTVSSTEITAYAAASGHVQITPRTGSPPGTTATVWAVSATAFAGTPPLKTVPGVVGLSLKGAMEVVEQYGFAPIGASGPTGTNAIVQKQTPAGGAKAPIGSTVSLMTVAAARGYSKVTLVNNMQHQRGVNVWLFDQATNAWSGGSAVAFGSTTTLELKTGRSYFVLALDPSQCGGQNDVSNAACEYWRLPGVPGDEEGPSTAVPIN